MSALPAARSRVVLHQVSAASWEHPADRAALQALRAVPGVDDVIRKLMSVLGGERGIRLLFQGNAVRTGPHQFPTLHALQVEVATTFDWPEVPEVYVSQAPVFTLKPGKISSLAAAPPNTARLSNTSTFNLAFAR